MARSNEPLWWAPFSAGMMVGALFVPALILITGVIWPFLRPTEADVARALVLHPLTKILLVVVISLSLFHWAHRFRYIVFDLGLKGGRKAVAALCYSAALVGSVITVLIALNVV